MAAASDRMVDDALAAVALASLIRQCFDLGRPADGLEVVQLAQYATRRIATPRLRAVLATREAWAYAQQGDARAFRRAVGLAEDHHGEGIRDADARAPTVRSLDDAELAGVIGARYRDLAHPQPTARPRRPGSHRPGALVAPPQPDPQPRVRPDRACPHMT